MTFDEMPWYEKLDETLRHLKKWNQGSFQYFLNSEEDLIKHHNFPKDTQKEKHSRLFQHYDKIGIRENERLPIINELAEEGYIQKFYRTEDDKKTDSFPHQIKITFKGLRLIENGGFEQQLQDGKFLQKIKKSGAIATLIGGISAAVVGVYYLLEIVRLIYSWFCTN